MGYRRSRSSRRSRSRRRYSYGKLAFSQISAGQRSRVRNGRSTSSSSSESRSDRGGRSNRYRTPSSSSSSRTTSRSSSSSDSVSSSGTGDDPIIHFDWEKGMSLGSEGRYRVLRQLGDGTFGRVLECDDRVLRTRVAVKVIRDVDRYRENAKVECRILKRVQEIRRLSSDKRGSRGVVRFFDDFMHNRFYCLSFERLGKTLYEVIQMNNHRGFYTFDIQAIAREFLETLAFLHDECGLTHTDIKMENIMLCGTEFLECNSPPRISSSNTKYFRPILVSEQTGGRHRSIRIIDFGNGVFRGDHHSTTVNTRQYRAPEVILEQGWDEKSDLWSAGCCIAEMWTGELLFPTHENMEHLAMIERVTGERIGGEIFSFSPPQIRRKFERNNDLNWPEGCVSSESFRRVNDCEFIERLFGRERELAELVARLLRIDPRRRYSASKALRNCDFFHLKIPFNE